MVFDSDVALVGTGAAALAAAIHLLAEGKSVLILNPDLDFFLEDSELPFDPLFPFHGIDSQRLDSTRLRRSSVEIALEELRPSFPGAVEQWSDIPSAGFKDRSAPFVRSRARLWVTQKGLEGLEDLYVKASDAGCNLQILEGLQICKRFPGAPHAGDWNSEGIRGLWVPKIYDVDVTRYRNGLLEFARERSTHMICNATQIEVLPKGVRFYSKGKLHTVNLKEGLLAFWTPRLTQWVLNQAKEFEVAPVMPQGIRLWEQWSLISRSTAHPGVMGIFDDCAVWAEVEGNPDDSAPLNRIAMLRAGPLESMDSLIMGLEPRERLLFNTDSFYKLRDFFYGFLRWEKITVREMKSRSVFEWASDHVGLPWRLSKSGLPAKVVNGCDGPLADVVRVARQSCGELI